MLWLGSYDKRYGWKGVNTESERERNRRKGKEQPIENGILGGTEGRDKTRSVMLWLGN